MTYTTRRTGRIRAKKTCKECGSEFEQRKPLQVYCGHKCSNTAGNRKRASDNQVELTCLGCKEKFIKRKSDIKIYPGSLSKKRYSFCSRGCMNEYNKKKVPISSLKKKAWNVFSLYIKNRDNWTCFTCGKYSVGADMHAGHYISRRYGATLYDESNVHAQCAGCNAFKNGEPHLYAEKLISIHGVDFLLELTKKSKEVKKFTREELIGIYEKYKGQEKPYEKPGKRGFL